MVRNDTIPTNVYTSNYLSTLQYSTKSIHLPAAQLQGHRQQVE